MFAKYIQKKSQELFMRRAMLLVSYKKEQPPTSVSDQLHFDVDLNPNPRIRFWEYESSLCDSHNW